jgi:uncharacterized protein (TIGR02757 family)
MGADAELKALLEKLYSRYNGVSCAAADPVSFLCAYEDVREREVAGLIAAFLAYGRLGHIMRSVADALRRLGPEPRAFLLSATPQGLREACDGFVHRMADAESLWRLLCALKNVLESRGSLEACLLAHDRRAQCTVLPGLCGLAAELRCAGSGPGHLMADPSAGSACKRWNLYLRWMVRRDAVDPGGWTGVSPSRLIVPLDVHTWRLWSSLGLTKRRTCNLKAALDITEALRALVPDDPVRYDFALMHASVAGDAELAAHVAAAGPPHRGRGASS